MSRDHKKTPLVQDRQAQSIRAMPRKAAMADPEAMRAEKIGRKAGNQEVEGQIKGANGKRDALLAFILQRLSVVKGVQQKELAEMKDERDWYKEVARGNKGFGLPDPTRWHESAKAYKRAGEALANGNLGQGAALLDRAMEAERAAFQSVPDQVRQNFEAGEEEVSMAGGPAELGHVQSSAVSARVSLPKGLSVAMDILNVTSTMEADALDRQRKPPWWETEEEGEEQEGEAKAATDKDKDKADDKKKKRRS